MKAMQDAESGVELRNEVVLVGRVSKDPELKTLPSGDELVSFRVVVERAKRSTDGRRQVDALECAVWGGRAKRTASSFRAGDVVEVHGALRRRFFRSGAGAASLVEVEVSSTRRVHRPSTA